MSRNVLGEIVENRRKQAATMKELAVKRMKPLVQVGKSLRMKPFIAEVKKSSPSKGAINVDVDVAEQAARYASFGAGAISVLVDETYFGGSYTDLAAVATRVSLPVLCKDFVVSEVQVENAYRAGADMVLLMASVLDDAEMQTLAGAVSDRGMKILFEVHSFAEYERIASLSPDIVGVNSRDLKTLNIDRQAAAALMKRIPPSHLRVAESGLETGSDVRLMKEAGADAFLIGTALMKSKNLKATFDDLYAGVR